MTDSKAADFATLSDLLDDGVVTITVPAIPFAIACIDRAKGELHARIRDAETKEERFAPLSELDMALQAAEDALCAFDAERRRAYHAIGALRDSRSDK